MDDDYVVTIEEFPEFCPVGCGQVVETDDVRYCPICKDVWFDD